jgi:hypothetical protein
MLRETLVLHNKVLGEEHRDGLECKDTLAVALSSQRKYAEAEKIHRNTLEFRREACIARR